MNWTNDTNFGTRNRKKLERIKMSVYMNRQKEFKKQMESKGQSIYSINDKEATKSSSDFKRLKTIIGSSLRLQDNRNKSHLNHQKTPRQESSRSLSSVRLENDQSVPSLILPNNQNISPSNQVNRSRENNQNASSLRLDRVSLNRHMNFRREDNQSPSSIRSQNNQSMSNLRLEDKTDSSLSSLDQINYNPQDSHDTLDLRLPNNRPSLNQQINFNSKDDQNISNLRQQDSKNKSSLSRLINYRQPDNQNTSNLRLDSDQSLSSLMSQLRNASSLNYQTQESYQKSHHQKTNQNVSSPQLEDSGNKSLDELGYELEDNQSAACESRSDELGNLQNSQLNNNLSQSSDEKRWDNRRDKTLKNESAKDLVARENRTNDQETESDLFYAEDSDYFSVQVSTLNNNSQTVSNSTERIDQRRRSTRFF